MLKLENESVYFQVSDVIKTRFISWLVKSQRTKYIPSNNPYTKSKISMKII